MIINEDLEIIAQDIKEKGIKDSKIVITGSTGLLGSLMARGFALANRKYNLNNKIYALARNEEKAKVCFKGYEKEGITIVKNEITAPVEIDGAVDYIFHTAAVTKSKDMITYPVELIKTSVNGSFNVLDFALSHNAKSVVYFSSMEMYGVLENSNKKLKENDLGYLDLSNIRNCYPESKRLVENLCTCYASEYGLNVMIARLTQTFGAGASYDENKIYGMIARNTLEKKDIVLMTKGGSVRDYCYTTDAINAVLTIATKGEKGQAYNIANPNTNNSIKGMAELVAREFGEGKVKVKIEAAKTGGSSQYGADSIIKLNVDKLEALGWKARYDLKELVDVKNNKKVITNEKI